jgi:hypothetical protein
MTRRLTRLLAGALVLLLTCVGVTWASVERGWSDGWSATCSPTATIDFQGREYGWWDAVRVPQPWGPLGRVEPPDCYLGGGRFAAYEITGVKPEIAILVWSPEGLSVWLGPGYRTGERELPGNLAVLGLPVACTMESPMDLIAIVRSANPPLSARTRPPYTLALQVSGNGIGYSSDALVTPQVTVTEDTEGGDRPLTLRSRMYEFADGTQDPQRVSVTLHCEGDEYVADSIEPR